MAKKATATSKRAVRKSENPEGQLLNLNIAIRVTPGRWGNAWGPSETLDAVIDYLEDALGDDGCSLTYAAEATELTPALFKETFEGLRS